MYGISYKGNFDNITKETNEYKIRVIGSNISLDRFYLDIDPVSVIKELKLPPKKVTEVISKLKPLSGRGEKLIIKFSLAVF